MSEFTDFKIKGTQLNINDRFTLIDKEKGVLKYIGERNIKGNFSCGKVKTKTLTIELKNGDVLDWDKLKEHFKDAVDYVECSFTCNSGACSFKFHKYTTVEFIKDATINVTAKVE